MLSRQKSVVDALAADATLQKTRLLLLKNGIHRWKQKTFARADILILAFLAGMAVAPSNKGKHSDDTDRTDDSGQSFPVKALEASFLAWRLFGQQVKTGATSSGTSTDNSIDL